MSPRELIRAAGGVILRPGRHGRAEILAVHRARYDDWTLPKGKCNPGESDELAIQLRRPLRSAVFRGAAQCLTLTPLADSCATRFE